MVSRLADNFQGNRSMVSVAANQENLRKPYKSKQPGKGPHAVDYVFILLNVLEILQL